MGVAVVTALPLGCDDNFLNDKEPRETAEISVFDIKDGGTKFQKRHKILMPMSASTSECNLSMALSNGGELLSIETTHEFNDAVSWRVYDLTSSTTDTEEPEAIVRADELKKTYYGDRFRGHQSGPDDELWICLPKEIDVSAHFGNINLPAWFSERMIVVRDDGFGENDEDDSLLLLP